MKGVFRCSKWEDGDYIVSARASDQKPWEDTPLGTVVTEQEGKAVVRWLQHLSTIELKALVKLDAHESAIEIKP